MSVAAATRMLLQLGFLAILARLISPYEFGVVGAALVAVALAELISRFGLAPALVQRSSLHGSHLSAALLSSSFLSIVAAAILFLSAGTIGSWFGMAELPAVLKVLVLFMPFTALGVVSDALLQRSLSFRYLALSDVLPLFLAYGVLALPLAILGYGIWALVSAELGRWLIRMAMLLAKSPPRLERIKSFTDFTSLAKFGGGFSLGRLGSFAASQGEKLVIAKLLGAAALGLYGRAYQAAALPAGIIGRAIEEVLFPYMSSVRNQETVLRRAYTKALSVTALLAGPYAVVLLVLGNDIILLLLGERWIEATKPLQILAFAVLARIAYKCANPVVRALGLVYHAAAREWLYALMVIGGTAMGARWGLVWATVGISAAISIHCIFMLGLANRSIGLGWGSIGLALGPGLNATVMTAGLLILVTTLCDWAAVSSSLTVAASGSVLVGAAVCLLRWPRLLGREAGELIGQVTDLTRRRLSLHRHAA